MVNPLLNSVIVADPTANLTVKLEYRTNLNQVVGSWTELASDDDERYIVAQNIGARFQLLQLRVTFTDTTSTNPDTRLENIAVTYSYGIK